MDEQVGREGKFRKYAAYEGLDCRRCYRNGVETLVRLSVLKRDPGGLQVIVQNCEKQMLHIPPKSPAQHIAGKSGDIDQ
jgi:hypothetical protein